VAQSLSQELLRQGVQAQALRLPSNQIRLDLITSLGHCHFVPILDSEQQVFRAPKTTTKYVFDHGIKGVRRLIPRNPPNDTRQAGLDASPDNAQIERTAALGELVAQLTPDSAQSAANAALASCRREPQQPNRVWKR